MICYHCPRYGDDGDVTLCTKCGQWWYFDRGAVLTPRAPISKSEAAAQARAPMQIEKILAAFEQEEYRFSLMLLTPENV